MAVIKKKGNKSLPPISTASLPDVIFMILFFFMVSTTMRDQELHVKYQVPEATEVQKLEKKSLVSYIHIGEPIGVWREQYGPAPRIQLNDAFKTAQDIGQFVAAERDKLNESERALMTICLKADRYTTMGRITEIKQELRRANDPENFLRGCENPGILISGRDSFPKGMCQIEKFRRIPFQVCKNRHRGSRRRTCPDRT